MIEKKIEMINKFSDDLFEEGVDAARKIWNLAEPPFQEHESVEILSELLQEHGFTIKYPFDEIPTAFKAVKGQGKPVIGFLGEYDALPDCGLEKGKYGHGCGHNLLGTGSALAAIITAELLEQNQIEGTVVYWGCPAEEILGGKVYMAREGAFTDLDACLGWHPGSSNQVNNAGGTALDSLVFEFSGKTAHGAYAHNGRSALDAAILMDTAVNYLREHIPDNIRIHSVIQDGGNFPNVVPEFARSWYYVRGKDREQVDEITRRVKLCAKGASISTETEYKMDKVTAVYNLLPNDKLAENLLTNFKKVGVPQPDKGKKELYKKQGIKPEFKNELDTEIQTEPGKGSSDEANVSWITPYGRINAACMPDEVPGHHRDATFCNKQPFAYKGMVNAGKVLAASAYDLFEQPELLQEVIDEFKKKTKDFTYDPLIAEDQTIDSLVKLYKDN